MPRDSFEELHAMRAVFFGSTEFALPTLQAVREEFALPLVVVHPDTESGRGRRKTAPPAALFARRHGIECIGPQSIRDASIIKRVAAARPDFIVVADYGKKIPREIASLAAVAALNLHPSLLPRHRGPSPIPYTILSGDKAAGNSIIGLADVIDSGPIWAQERIDLLPDETAGVLAGRLSIMGARLMVDTMRRLAVEPFAPREQDHELATYAPMLAKEDGLLDFGKPVVVLERTVRAMQPWPMAYCTLPLASGGRMRVNLYRAACEVQTPPAAAGTIVGADKNGIRVAAADGVLKILALQPAGRKPMSAAEFLNGHRIGIGLAAGRSE